MSSFWKKKRVLVTGATGLVGSHLIEKLITLEADVFAFVLETPKTSLFVQKNFADHVYVIKGNLAVKESVFQGVIEAKPQIIIHLGAQTIVGNAIKDPLETFESNIQGTYFLLEAARLHAKNLLAIVVASSDKAYGTAKTLPYTEEFPLHGDGPYDVSKSCTDLLAQSYGFTYQLPVSVARCGNIYGAGDINWSRIVPGTFKSIFMHEQPILRSDGTFLRDYIYVEDVVDAYLLLAEKSKTIKPGTAYNFSNDMAYTVDQIYREICEAAVGQYVEPRYLNAAGNEIHDQHLSSENALKDFGWKSTRTLESGLKQTSLWYQAIINEIQITND
jgi:CDP-glucose 4,6-dehydratase